MAGILYGHNTLNHQIHHRSHTHQVRFTIRFGIAIVIAARGYIRCLWWGCVWDNYVYIAIVVAGRDSLHCSGGGCVGVNFRSTHIVGCTSIVNCICCSRISWQRWAAGNSRCTLMGDIATAVAGSGGCRCSEWGRVVGMVQYRNWQ